MYELPHEVQDEAKVEQLAAAMQQHGWQGAPVVVWDYLQITGVHRAAAAEIAGIELETIDLADVFAADGADFDAAVEAYNAYDCYDPHLAVLITILPHLSDSIKAEYGIDLH